MKILFWARPAKARKWVTLYCRITVNGIRAKTDFSTGIAIPANKWDAANQRAIGQSLEYANLQLSEISDGIRGIASMLRGRGAAIDADTVRAEWLKSQNPAPEAGLHELFLQYAELKKPAPASLAYHVFRRRALAAFIEGNKGDPARMQAAFAGTFAHITPATQKNHLAYLNAFLKWAASEGRPARPLEVAIKTQKKPLLTLSKEQMQEVISGAGEGPAKDFMLLQLCTGLAFADAAGIGPQNLKDAGGDLGFYLEVSRQKSGAYRSSR